MACCFLHKSIFHIQLQISNFFILIGKAVYKDRRIEADLDLGYEGKTFSLHTYQGKDRKDQLEIEIKGINLTALSRSIPFVPDLGGLPQR